MFRDTDTASGQLTAAMSMAGVFVRYAFFLFGAIVFGMIGLGFVWVWNSRVKVVEDVPSFRIADGSVARLNVSSSIIAGGMAGRVEVMQYTAGNNRGLDLTVVMAYPKPGSIRPRLGLDLNNLAQLRATPMRTYSTHYDLDTRYGAFHAVEGRMETDGRWKQCLSYNSRFTTNAVLMEGFLCDASGSKPGADALACLLDRLVIDKTLASGEAEAYLRPRLAMPASCGSRPVTQTFDTGTRPISPPSRWSQPSARTRL